MNNLRMLRDMFGDVPIPSSIKQACLDHTRGTGYKEKAGFLLYWFGCRSHNQYLNYGYLLLKLVKHLRTIRPHIEFYNYPKPHDSLVVRLAYYLLLDDRHDLWQNLPLCLESVISSLPFTDRDGHWEAIYHIVIDCINERGTGN